jgi:hypothetical protein
MSNWSYKSIYEALGKVEEEKIITIKSISNKSDEILSALNEFKIKHNINDMLPYYDYILDLLLECQIIDQELVLKYCEVFFETIRISNINSDNLRKTLRDLRYSFPVSPFKDLYNSLHWYQKLQIRFFDLIENIQAKFRI